MHLELVLLHDLCVCVCVRDSGLDWVSIVCGLWLLRSDYIGASWGLSRLVVLSVFCEAAWTGRRRMEPQTLGRPPRDLRVIQPHNGFTGENAHMIHTWFVTCRVCHSLRLVSKVQVESVKLRLAKGWETNPCVNPFIALIYNACPVISHSLVKISSLDNNNLSFCTYLTMMPGADEPWFMLLSPRNLTWRFLLLN